MLMRPFQKAALSSTPPFLASNTSLRVGRYEAGRQQQQQATGTATLNNKQRLYLRMRPTPTPNLEQRRIYIAGASAGGHSFEIPRFYSRLSPSLPQPALKNRTSGTGTRPAQPSPARPRFKKKKKGRKWLPAGSAA